MITRALPSLLALVAGCAGSSPVGSIASDVSAPPAWLNQQGDSADTGCNVVLRESLVTLHGRGGPETDCSSGTCWVVITGSFDVSTAVAGAAPGVLYQSALDGVWRQAAAQSAWGAGLGFRRYDFTLNHDTFTAGPSSTVKLIPFVRTVAGGRGFDHNRIPDSMGSYTLSPDDNWSIPEDGSCPAAAPRGTETLSFSLGWQDSAQGSLVQNGKLDVSYDVQRIPSGLGCTHDGVPAFAVTAFAQFQPGGAVASESIDGPLEFDVPAGAASVALWFLDSSECNGDEWDSRYGANYVYSVSN